MTTDTEKLRDLERRRCAAISAADADALRALLTDDYAHVHATGRVDDLDTYIEVVVERPRTTERGDFSIRQYGDAAVLIGDQYNTINGEKSAVVVSQVAVREDGGWRFAMIHVVRKTDS